MTNTISHEKLINMKPSLYLVTCTSYGTPVGFYAVVSDGIYCKLPTSKWTLSAYSLDEIQRRGSAKPITESDMNKMLMLRELSK